MWKDMGPNMEFMSHTMFEGSLTIQHALRAPIYPCRGPPIPRPRRQDDTSVDLIGAPTGQWEDREGRETSGGV